MNSNNIDVDLRKTIKEDERKKNITYVDINIVLIPN